MTALEKLSSSEGCATVLVVGAGLAGLTAARILRQAGISVDLVEHRAAAEHPSGAGLIVTANGIGALQRLGLLSPDAGLPLGRRIASLALRRSDDRSLGNIDCERIAGQQGFYAISHAELLAFVGAGTEVQYERSVASMVNSNQRVAVQFTDGERRSYSLVIGADGIKSKVRELALEAPTINEFDRFTGWRFITSVSAHPIEQPTYFYGNGCSFLLVPLNNGRVYCAAGPVDARSVDVTQPWLDLITRAFSDFCDPVRTFLQQISPNTVAISSRFGSVEVKLKVQSGVVLIGDAAHAMPPTLSQGAAMAFEDVEVLIDSLNHARDIDSGLTAYQDRRQQRVGSVQQESVRRLNAVEFVAPRIDRARSFAFKMTAARSIEQIWNELNSERP